MKKAVLNRFVKIVVIYILAVIVFLFLTAPMLWTIISSLKYEADLAVEGLNLIPRLGWTTFNYEIVFNLRKATELPSEAGSPFSYAQFLNAVSRYVIRSIFNSSLIGISIAIINIVLASLAGYAFNRFSFPLKNASFMTLIAVRMVPGLAIIIPLYILFKNLAILDTYLAIILAHLFYTLPFSIWIMTGYVWSIPKEIEEAAKLDGCTNIQILFRIVFPLLLPGIAAIGVMSFMFSWGEFFFAMILTKSYDIRTLPVILASALEVGEQFVYGPVNALAAISIVPSIAISLLAQKLLIAGLTKGAIKA